MKKIFYSFFATIFSALMLVGCEDVPAPYLNPNSGEGGSEEVTGEYLNETFNSSFGKFEALSAADGGFDWIIKFNCAVGTGYQDGVNKASASYLVSPEMNLGASKGAFLQFEYQLGYANNPGNDKVYITDNYTGDPKTTAWTDITGTLETVATWGTWSSYNYNIPAAFIGKSNVRIAFYFDAPETRSKTWEIRNVVVKEGVSPNGDVPNGTVVTEEDGSQEKPFTVTNALIQEAKTGVWVKGYIVGYVYGQKIADGKVFGSDTCTVQTNLLIASTPDEKDYTKCMPVQLPKGDIRTGLNLKDNKGNIRQEVLLLGDLATYYGVPGVKNVTAAVLNGKVVGKDPNAEPAYKKVVAIAEGKYVLGAVKDGATHAVALPLDAAKNYGFLNTTDVTVAGDALTTDVANEFTFTKADGGYTIQDASGRYYYMSGTYDSFQVSASLPAADYVWEVTFNDQGNVLIKNVGKGKTIQFSTKYNSFGAYTDITNVLPILFKK